MLLDYEGLTEEEKKERDKRIKARAVRFDIYLMVFVLVFIFVANFLALR